MQEIASVFTASRMTEKVSTLGNKSPYQDRKQLARNQEQFGNEKVFYREKNKQLVYCPYCDAYYWDNRINGMFYLDCPICDKAVYSELKDKHKRETENRIIDIRKNCNIDAEMQHKHFSNFDTRGDKECVKAKKEAQAFATGLKSHDRGGKGLYIYGGYGCGKTHLSVAIANDAIAKEVKVYYTTFGDMGRNIRDAMKYGAELSVINKYIGFDLLIIDDLGKEKPTEWSMSVLFNIINTRYSQRKRLIVTSNYTSQALINKLTPIDSDDGQAQALVSRFYEMLMPIKMQFEDYRKKGWE